MKSICSLMNSQFISHVFAWSVCGLSLSILRCDLCLTNRFYLVILKKLTASISISGRLGQKTTPGGGELPYKGLMGTCGQPGYVFRDFCLKQGIEFIIFCLNQGIDLSVFVLNRMSFLG